MRKALKLLMTGLLAFVGLVVALVALGGILYALESPEERAEREARLEEERRARARESAAREAREHVARAAEAERAQAQARAQETAAAPGFAIGADGVVTKADIGERWPLTVERVQLRCLAAGALSSGAKVWAIFMHAKGKAYALNGLAKGRAAKLGWKVDLGPLATGSLSPLIELGTELCETHGPTDAEPTIAGNGTFLVGSDVQPGTYRSSGGAACYWARLRDLSGGIDSILANNLAQGPAVVQIKKTDKAFQTQGCARWESVGGGLVALRPVLQGS